MRFRSLLFSVVNLFVCFAIIIFGLFVVMIPFSPVFKESLALFFQSNDTPLLLLGGISILFGLFLLIILFYGYRRSMLVITMGEKKYVSIDEKAVQKYVAEYWKELFPKAVVKSHVHIYRNQIYISVDIPSIKGKDPTQVLEEIEAHLTLMLDKYFNYRDKFHLDITFQSYTQVN